MKTVLLFKVYVYSTISNQIRLLILMIENKPYIEYSIANILSLRFKIGINNKA